ncbi:MAG: valine--tRNA ligase [Candidatus Omnitrophica bacterium]|nr:valine--tRNA ligase [Candidatus Omnitrophota bacterium]
MELSKRFDFKTVDAKWSKDWEDKNLFHAKADTGKPPYTIVIPPPNVTGILHMGHALNNTLQDIIIRYKRMKGFEALWMPGTDHAGIATQNVVEKALAKEGKKRHDLGREAFLEKLWAWKKQYGDTIINQLKKIGASCDWKRTRFTMDDAYSNAVKEVFVRLYEKDLIYRGTYIINWCPRCHTALSDEEAEHKDTKGHLYHIRYPLKENPDQFIVVATTRPETMLGDTAVAVNPKDERYQNLIGKILILPLVNREIPIITDELVDREFGSGAVKVTPAHDPNDYQMGKRHNLEFINIMHPDGKINEQGGVYNGLDRFVARKKILEDLEAQGLLVKTDDHLHAVGHCYRCDTVVEPYLSKQWFVRMTPLAQPGIEAVKDGRIKFYPERWSKVYLNWMEGIRDWCISRQIWWGHRIPVWYCQDCQMEIVVKDTPAACPKCHSKNLKQDEDVLDTWFSSWLWPFATLGWPQENADLKYFYPTSSLFTASEIIFFWVARMIMAGFEFRGDIPFSDVYIHGTVRDAKGRKMSKSLGNAIDPLEIIEEYGADALRFSLIINSGQDLFISKEKFEIGRNFANKIWNASRLILMNAQTIDPSFKLSAIKNMPDLDLPSKWIISRLYTTIKDVSDAIEHYRYSEAESLIYEFFWNNFCDWYLEIIKNDWANPTTQNIVFKILAESLKIIHPFMPFVTEEIWENIKKSGQSELCIQPWPTVEDNLIDPQAEKNMRILIEHIVSIRNSRAEWEIKPNEELSCQFASSSAAVRNILENNIGLLKSLAKIKDPVILPSLSQTQNVIRNVFEDSENAISLEGVIDVEKEKGRILKQLDEYKKAEQGLADRLANAAFVEKAPAEVVAKDKERLQDLQKKIEKLQQAIKGLI